MSRSLTASDRASLIRLASSLPQGSPERRAILAGFMNLLRGRKDFKSPREAEKILEKVITDLWGGSVKLTKKPDTSDNWLRWDFHFEDGSPKPKIEIRNIKEDLAKALAKAGVWAYVGNKSPLVGVYGWGTPFGGGHFRVDGWVGVDATQFPS